MSPALPRRLEGKKAEEVIGHLTEVMPGRPTILEHRYPLDDIRAHYDKHTVDPLSRLHVLTVLAGEQQTMNFYMTVGNRFTDPLARALYLETAQIEEQHVTQYESLLDPLESWLQQEVFHHYNECYLYHSFLSQETDPRIKQLWELHLNMEIEHLRIASEMLRRYEGIKAAEILPQDAPYFTYLQTVNGGGFVPSEQVVADRVSRGGGEYRLESEGPHPVESLQQQV